MEEMSATHYLAYKEKLVSRFSPGMLLGMRSLNEVAESAI